MKDLSLWTVILILLIIGQIGHWYGLWEVGKTVGTWGGERRRA